MTDEFSLSKKWSKGLVRPLMKPRTTLVDFGQYRKFKSHRARYSETRKRVWWQPALLIDFRPVTGVQIPAGALSHLSVPVVISCDDSIPMILNLRKRSPSEPRIGVRSVLVLHLDPQEVKWSGCFHEALQNPCQIPIGVIDPGGMKNREP